ncbi:hypothetical protein HDU91_006439 [Kappamyces sp. JEL0680]|nr:hypothetical protein HDU91_006439 [Kappamyces sp. JEL0680]
MSSKGKIQHFYSFAQVIQNYSKDIPKHLSRDIPSSLKWFKHHSNAKTFRDAVGVLDGVEVSEETKSLLDDCLFLQPIQDRLQSCVVDLQEWLIKNQSKLVCLDKNVTAAHLVDFHQGWEALFRIPYVKPTDETYDFFEKLTMDPRTSSDTFAHLIKAAYDNMLKFLALQQTIDPETIVTNHEIKAMKMKAEEFIRIINDNVANVDISHLMLRNIYELVVEGLAIYDPDPFSGLHDACNSLKASLDDINDNISKVRNEPPKMTIEAKRSPLIRLLEMKGQKDQESKLLHESHTNLGTGALSRLYQSDMSISQLALDYQEEQEQDLERDDLLDVHDIWIEIDPLIDRLLEIKDTTSQSEGIMCSDYSGRFQFSSTKILWFGIPKDLADKAADLASHGLWDAAVMIPFTTIEKFIIEPIAAAATTPLAFEGGLPVSPVGIPSPPFHFNGNRRSEGNASDEKTFYLSIYTRTEVYRLFPFVEKETKFLKDAFYECAGLKPSFQDHVVRKLLTEKLFNERREILEDLLMEELPWLDSSIAISKTISELTDETRSPDPVELERLFHSCRMEKAVTNETIVLLQILLRITDRLIDPQVMQKSDTAFLVLHAWLRTQEQYLNPYKRLLKRCKTVSMDQLTPLVLSHTKSTFDRWEDFSNWLASYNVSKLKVDSES